MGSLILTSNEVKIGAVFKRRVLIGRKPFNGVQISSQAVSRIHAWIDRDGETFYVADAHSRNGVFVNQQRITEPTKLHSGDVIVIGPERIEISQKDELPEGVIEFEINADGTNPQVDHRGILTECAACGAPTWVPKRMAGAYGRCAVCNKPLTIPGDPAGGSRRPLTPHDSISDYEALSDATVAGMEAILDFPRPSPTAVKKTCAICNKTIEAGQKTKPCPACSQAYHAECWKSNGGCAAYGCSQAPSTESDGKSKPSWQAAPVELEEAVPVNGNSAPAEVRVSIFRHPFIVLGRLLSRRRRRAAEPAKQEQGVESK